ncbi:S-adenosylmethionine transporter [Malassezia vespertilionis]|uniref:Uncharacterized protein n=1 Tax=Malassezia vespertilionis TaxID=2020962 RepID=A0A2N1JCU4_9BASI|nr:S-adenosylmethionine transporter [Malassezia vespertilionis]PKI84391.1 hypothetical protein MVES_001789 [Malassezia vespertilionis]WFD06537.1 S-adenosylmethionine transporter [Malassezia vespertilionis]
MDIWQINQLGHRSVPSLWTSGKNDGATELSLGDLRQTPTSVQVFNACLFDKLRGRSDDCGLGLTEERPASRSKLVQEDNDKAAAPESRSILARLSARAPQSLTDTRQRPSLRAHAKDRLGQQKIMHEKISASTDTKKLLWEAQMAVAAHQYTLAAALYRRAANLGSGFACAALAKLFGFGVMRPTQKTFLFERDTLRGIAWGLLGVEQLTEQVKAADTQSSEYASLWSLLNQMLVLLCTFVCAPEVFRTLVFTEQHADLSMHLLLLFPRAYELWSPSSDLAEALQMEENSINIWFSMRITMVQVASLVSYSPKTVDASDHASLEPIQALTRLHVKFLESFLAMRTAFATKLPGSTEAAHTSWSTYLAESKLLPQSVHLARFQQVAAEGLAWAAPDTAQNTSEVTSDSEFAALSQRILRIFPFAKEQSISRRTALNAFQDVSNTKDTNQGSFPPKPRLHKSASSASLMLTNGLLQNNGPTLLARPSISLAESSQPLSDHIHATGKQQPLYSGSTSDKLRSMTSVIATRQRATTAPKRGARRLSTASTAEMPSYLTQMNESFTSQTRRRTSSIVSVSPSLLIPSGSGASVQNASDAPTAFVKGEVAHANASPFKLSGVSSMQNLRAQLQRQTSTQNLKGGSTLR